MQDKYLLDLSLPAESIVEMFDELPLWSAPFAAMILERLIPRRHHRYLDLGCGTGFLSIELAERSGETSKVFAVDVWQEALDRLHRKLELRCIRNIEVIQCDASALPLPDASIETIVCNLGINNFDDPRKVLSECNRVAVPGALMYLTTNTSGHMSEFYQVFRSCLIELGQAAVLPKLDEHIAHRGSREFTVQVIHEAGFETTNVVERSMSMRFSDGTSLLNHYFTRLAFLPTWKSLVGPELQTRVLQAVERRLNEISSSRSCLELTIPMLLVEAQKRT